MDVEARPQMLTLGPWAIVHAICDRIVDVYVEITADLQNDVDTVEAGVFNRGSGISVG